MNLLSVIPVIGNIIDDVFTTDEEKAEAKLKMMALIQSGKAQELVASKDVLVAEIKGESWLQRNWRPIFMLSFVAIIVNNYILFPYLSLLEVPATVVEIPEKMWSLLQIGVGGYIIGRSTEKTAKTLKGK